MPCDHIHGAIVCSRGPRRKRCCACTQPGSLLCDWKVGAFHTCDAPICPAHALEVSKDKHLCPKHQEAYKKWLAGKASA